ncbi:MAG: hypothetical protein ACK5TR_04955 [Alphaproteobacteria bacterium]|jgi:hypothetical protein|nr:hypothetical protein [Alphaproteobacteria bacterium]
MHFYFNICFIFILSATLYASDPRETLIEQTLSTKKGSMFQGESYILVEEVLANQVRRTHPLSSKPTLATVEMVSPRAILHQSYLWRTGANVTVQSFAVTPPQDSHTELSSESLPQNIYAKIPVRLGSDQTLELLVFEEPEAGKQKDYAVTVASALKLILATYIPKARQSGFLPYLKQVIVKDSNPFIALKFLGKSDQQSLLTKYYDSTTYSSATDTSSFWEITYRVRDGFQHIL